eukprot:COSAG01_NODE_3330_length_6246_cov_4.593298_6_plen_103_part_00
MGRSPAVGPLTTMRPRACEAGMAGSMPVARAFACGLVGLADKQRLATGSVTSCPWSMRSPTVCCCLSCRESSPAARASVCFLRPEVDKGGRGKRQLASSATS